jgi:hypothetical protein
MKAVRLKARREAYVLDIIGDGGGRKQVVSS